MTISALGCIVLVTEAIVLLPMLVPMIVVLIRVLLMAVVVVLLSSTSAIFGFG